MSSNLEIYHFHICAFKVIGHHGTWWHCGVGSIVTEKVDGGLLWHFKKELVMKLTDEKCSPLRLGSKAAFPKTKVSLNNHCELLDIKLSRARARATFNPSTWSPCCNWLGLFEMSWAYSFSPPFNPCLWSSCNWVGHIAVRWRPITSRVSKPNLAWSRIAWSATAHAPLDRLISVWWDFVQNLKHLNTWNTLNTWKT